MRISTGLGLLALLPLAGFSTVSCTTDSGSEDESTAADLVAQRPQAEKFFSAIIKLSSPPLLASGQRVNGSIVISPSSRATVAAEHQAFIADLRSRSSQVKVLYEYTLVLNGVSVIAPVALRPFLVGLPGVASIEEETAVRRPAQLGGRGGELPESFQGANSSKFIGAERTHSDLGFTGTGIRVGVIDTGIDYTHRMFGGAGTSAAYASNNPTTVESGSFPTAKVIGGIDLVGTDYDSGSITEGNRVPKPDNDPLDEQGHGSHVSGTIAGHGDDVNTYDGIAPDAKLYAMKVFGKKGSTSEGPIIAAFEFAVDPNRDGNPDDHLDVVNLSLGSSWGTRLGLYTEVIKNVVSAGTVTVCSAGNAGKERYVTGSPGTSDDAISVAASVDNMPQNSREPADSLTDFSSWGPRSLDALLKPEISAPGENVISARMGGGAAGVAFSGTSMASPHITGVAALLKQAWPGATVDQIRSRIMNTALTIGVDGVRYPVSQQGAGRVQVFEAATSPLTMQPAALSLGVLASDAVVNGTRSVKLTNSRNVPVTAQVQWTTRPGLTVTGPASVTVPALGTVSLDVSYRVDTTSATVQETELDGFGTLTVAAQAGLPSARLQLPVLAVALRGAKVAVSGVTRTTGQLAVQFANTGAVSGDVLAFNLIAKDEIDVTHRAGACDLSSAGYRVVTRRVGNVDKSFVDFAVKLASPLSTWHHCEVSVQVDSNNDGKAEQEIAGTYDEDLRAQAREGDAAFGTFLVDAARMRSIKVGLERGVGDSKDFVTSVLDVQPFVRFPFSSVAYVSADLSKLVKTAAGKLRVKIGALPASGGAVVDDFLGAGEGTWFTIDAAAAPFQGMASTLKIAPQASTALTLRRTGTSGSLVLYVPENNASAGMTVIVPPTGSPVIVP